MPDPRHEDQEDPSEEGQPDHDGGTDDDPGGRGRTPPLEWALAAVGAVLVLGAAGFLLYEGLGARGAPPDVVVTVLAVRPAGAGYLAEFEAENRGQGTAAQVAVEGTLRQGGAEVERSSATLDYVPGESARRGGLYFTTDPRAHEIEVRATGYARP